MPHHSSNLESTTCCSFWCTGSQQSTDRSSHGCHRSRTNEIVETDGYTHPVVTLHFLVKLSLLKSHVATLYIVAAAAMHG